MTLTLIGTGVAFDITLTGLESLKAADEAYIETYTNPVADQSRVSTLETLCGKKFILIPREKVESKFLLERAKNKEVCLLVSGDPMIATTHVSLFLDAKELDVSVRIIHNSSIYSVAPALSGLQVYRFGKTATLVNPRPNYKPTSSLEIIRENQSSNLHTLVLLDTEPQPMEALTALETLKEFDSSRFILISRAGWPDQLINFGQINVLSKKNLGKPPFVIIVPTKPHVVEEEFLTKTFI